MTQNYILTAEGQIAPALHLNGTGYTTLNREYETAVEALDLAIQKVEAITVHGRDYYPQGDGAINRAVAEHRARLTALGNVKDQLAGIWLQLNKGD